MQNRMKYRFGGRLGKFLAGLLVSAAVAGCVRDDTDPLAGPDTGSSGELRIAFSIDGMEADTRAVATDPHERNLKDVHVLFFTQDGNYMHPVFICNLAKVKKAAAQSNRNALALPADKA